MPAPEFIPSPAGGGCPEGAGEGSIHVSSRLQSASARLQQALGLDRREARLEAQILTAHALGVDRAWLIAHDRDALSTTQSAAIETLITRRESGEPVAYILGEKEFYGRLFKVTPDVLIPRPETELLVEAALERLPKDRPARILDLGTGSGCIAITLALEMREAEVWAVDFNPVSLGIARENANRLDANDVRFVLSDWFEGVDVKNFDLIVANPPYIAPNDAHLTCGDVRFEPWDALVSGEDGLDDLLVITRGAIYFLSPQGWLLVEHGYLQGGICRNLYAAAGYAAISTLEDLAGHGRVTLGARRD